MRRWIDREEGQELFEQDRREEILWQEEEYQE